MQRPVLIFVSMFALTYSASAQPVREPAATLGRDLASPPATPESPAVPMPSPDHLTPGDASQSTGLLVGAVNIAGGREIPREIFAPVLETFIGQAADATKLQAMARAVANAARERGYLFASAIVPEQVVDSGTVIVRLDAGAVDRVRIIGSDNKRLRRVLDRLIGPAVRKDVLERQLLLAGDIPGIRIDNTNYVREPDGATLIVTVVEDRIGGSIGLDNHGSHDVGPARLRLRVDLTGLLDDADQLTTQLIVTPLQPKELTYGSVRYSIALGSGATQIGVAGALGRTKPGDGPTAGRLTGESAYGAFYVNHALLRANRTSLWINGELAVLRVDQRFDGVQRRRDDITTLSASMTAATIFAGGRLSVSLGIVQGLPINGATRAGDPMASRRDGSAVFTKATGWLDWRANLGGPFSLRLAASGQLASRPLLAAQELGVGGPGFGRGYDFSERFGDDGIVGLIELRERFDSLLAGVDGFEVFQFVDGGTVDNLRAGFGDGTRWSAGAGLRATIGKTRVGVELAFPLNARREDSDSNAPRVNLTVGQDF